MRVINYFWRRRGAGAELHLVVSDRRTRVLLPGELGPAARTSALEIIGWLLVGAAWAAILV